MKVTITLALLCIIGTILGFPAFVPVLVHSQPWTIFTAIFAHANFTHLVYNLFGLFIFGIILEKILNWKWYSLLIFISIAFSEIGFMLLSNPYIGAVGISGVIFGLIGALSVLKPKMIVYTPYGPLPMVLAAFFWAILEFVMLGAADTIAHSAHLFGLIGGISFALVYKFDKKIVPLLLLSFFIIFLIPLPSFPIYETDCSILDSQYTYHFSYVYYNCTDHYEIGIYLPSSKKVSIYDEINTSKEFLSELGNYSISEIFNGKGQVHLYGKINNSNLTVDVYNSKYTTLYLIKIY